MKACSVKSDILTHCVLKIYSICKSNKNPRCKEENKTIERTIENIHCMVRFN